MTRTRKVNSGPSPRGPLRPVPDVVSRRLNDQVVLVNLRDNRIYELNRTGSRLWELLPEVDAPEELVARLRAEFDVEEAELSGEVDSVLRLLLSQGLITQDPPDDG